HEINRLTKQYIYNLAGQQYQGGSGGVQQSTVGGSLGGWIQQALAALAAEGEIDVSKINPQHVAMIIQAESSGNPNAINNWDSNAAKGTPSKGLMQTIDPTFQANHVQGTSTNVYDPVANIAAGIKYGVKRYGSIENVLAQKGTFSGGNNGY
ncbi:transglycosylase SLT domain-containing protein, partial [Nocardia thraciensis]